MMPAFHIGTRLKKDAFVMADKLLRWLENMPLFIADGLQYYKLALLNELGISKREPTRIQRDTDTLS
jgi:hypothetical protein